MIYKKHNNFFLTHKEGALTALIALFCLVLFTFFPAVGASQKITSGIIFLCVLPLLYLKFILHKNLKNFGWQLGDWKSGLIFSSILLAAGLLLFYLLYHYTSFAKGYALPLLVAHNFWYFIFYELLLVGIFTALYENFFRGFIMFSLAPKAGIYAVFYQFFAIFLFFWITGSLNWNNSPFLITSFFSGLTSFKSRSMLYSFVASLLFFIILDALVIKFIHPIV